MFLNKVILSGRTTKKPEIRATKEGNKVTNFAVAITETYKDNKGEKREVTDFIDVAVFGKLAEVCEQYVDKGQLVIVEGKIKTRKWQTQAGETRYSTFVQAQNIQFGAKAQGKEKVIDHSEDESPKQSTENKEALADTGKGFEYPTEEINPEDIPF